MAEVINDRGLGNRKDFGRELGSVDAQFLDWIEFARRDKVDDIESKASKITISSDRMRELVTAAESKLRTMKI